MKKGKSSKSWREKLEKKIEPKIVDTPARWIPKMGEGKMLIPTPLLVDKVIREIPKGSVSSINAIREKLADDFKADVTCPLTTGIFLHIAANCAEEDKSKNKKSITPYWRVLKEDGSLNNKFPGGVKQQSEYLKQEGFTVIPVKGTEKLYVKDFQKFACQFTRTG